MMAGERESAGADCAHSSAIYDAFECKRLVAPTHLRLSERDARVSERNALDKREKAAGGEKKSTVLTRGGPDGGRNLTTLTARRGPAGPKKIDGNLTRHGLTGGPGRTSVLTYYPPMF